MNKSKKSQTKQKNIASVKKNPPKPVAPAKVMSNESVEGRVPQSITIPIDYLKYAAGVVIVLLLVLGYLARSWVVAAMVNGSPITRLALVSELEKQTGKQTLETLVTEKLIQQAASKEGVSVEQQEINDEISKIQEQLTSQGQDLDQLLAVQGQTRATLAEQIRVQKLIDKILSDKTAVTDEQVEAYLASNSADFPEEATAGEKLTLAREQLETETKRSVFSEWIGDLRAKAAINYYLTF